jgi:glutathione-dependent peroxiredoxin
MNQNNLINKENAQIPFDITFPARINDQWVQLTSEDIFKNKKVIIFSLPGAFTPTCSSSHLPRYEELYHTFKQEGIDEIYCVSVNDTFVMNEWAKAQEVENVKVLPDGNAELTAFMGMLVNKKNLGFGHRSWRYSMLVDNGVVVKQFIEPDVEGDPFEVSDADTMLDFLNQEAKAPKSITLFTKEGCPFCKEAKQILRDRNLQFSETILSDAIRQKVLRAITGENRPLTPQIFIDGELIGGTDKLKEKFNVQ